MRFFLIDKIVSWTPGESATAVKNVALSEDFFADHFPRRPVMPGMLIIEGMAQLAGVLLEETLEQRHGKIAKAVITIIERTKFREMVKPGDSLRYETEVVSVNTAGGKARCRALRGDREITSTTLTFGFKEVEDEGLERIRSKILNLWLEGVEKEEAEA